MKKRLYLCLAMMLTGCGCEYCDPWVEMDYTEASCGTAHAILTTSGCTIKPALTPVNQPVAALNNVETGTQNATAGYHDAHNSGHR